VTINGTGTGVGGGGDAIFPAAAANWQFQKVVDWNAVGAGSFIAVDEWQNSTPNAIHSHLSKIICKVKTKFDNASVSAAAITIVVTNPTDNVFYAFSKVLVDNEAKIFIGIAGSDTTSWWSPRINYASANNSAIKRALNYDNPGNNAAGYCNISAKYLCSEGKVLTHLLDSNQKILKDNIHQLLTKARTINNDINHSHIKLIVLHIGTTMDPCAICTRCLVGLSMYANNEADKSAFFKKTGDGAIGGNTTNATKFLIEISSCGHYAAKNAADNFNAYGFGNCSHTECAGHNNIAQIVNINTNTPIGVGVAANRLYLPSGDGTEADWQFASSFPPYIVFGRMSDTDPYGIAAAPETTHPHHIGAAAGQHVVVNLQNIQ
jgi:hypothetical protein